MTKWKPHKYPSPLDKPVYIDPERWPKAQDGEVTRLIPRGQLDYQAEIEAERTFRIQALFHYYSIEGRDLNAWREMACTLMEDLVPGMQVSFDEKPRGRGRRMTRTLTRREELVKTIDAIKSELAAKPGARGKISDLQAVRVAQKRNAALGTTKASSLVSRYRENKAYLRRWENSALRRLMTPGE